MTIINRERCYCSAKRDRGTCDSAVGIKATDPENRVLTGLKDILLGNEILIDASPSSRPRSLDCEDNAARANGNH